MFAEVFSLQGPISFSDEIQTDEKVKGQWEVGNGLPSVSESSRLLTAELNCQTDGG